jgi:tRNA pseudouridine13 synthase
MGEQEAAFGPSAADIDGLVPAIFKSTPEDFVVDEIPAYAASGKGEHVFVHFRKRDLTTHEAVRRLAEVLDVDPRGSGVAGQKDKVAVTTQTVSFPLPIARGELDVSAISLPGIEVLEARRHDHKLKPGHLVGNRFSVSLRGIDEAAAERLAARLGAAAASGVPNAYGPQRYGSGGDNPERALAWLRGQERGPRDKREQRFLFSSLQSHLFDRVLAERVAAASHLTVLAGDLAKKSDTGGMFLVPDEPAELADAQGRAARLELSATGPMFGASMRWPEGVPGEIERRVLEAGFGDEKRLKELAHLGEGTRRVLRLIPTEFVTFRVEGGLGVGFVLPKGGYATTFLGAVCRLEANRATPAEASRPDAPGEPEAV